MTPEGKPWLAAQPRGLEYWERLADVLEDINAELWPAAKRSRADRPFADRIIQEPWPEP